MRVLVALLALMVTTASAVGQTARDQHFEGELETRGARASFELRLEAGQIVTLQTNAAGLDTVLALNAPSGQPVAENDDQGDGLLTSRIVHVVRTSGAYTAVVTGFNGATGAFALDVSYGLDVGLSDAARVLREERRSFTERTNEIRLPVTLQADEIFVASTFALTEELDTTLTLRNAAGEVLAQNDDSGDGSLNSQIIYRAPRAGHYEIVASTYGGTGIGDFMLSLAVDPNAVAPFNFASLEGDVIATHEGEISDAHASHQYQVNLAAGQSLLAIAETTSGNLDPVLRVNGPDGLPVALNDDRGDGSLNAAVAFTARVAGVYTVELSRFRQGDSSGGFRLVLSSVEVSVVATLQALLENQVTLSGPEQVVETQDFRVIYTLEGRDASTEVYARSVAETLQTMLIAQERLGFAAPVRDDDGRYRAYVADARGVMGYAKAVQVVFDNPSTAGQRETAAARGVLVIDNDFGSMGKKASPESLMHATVTHEFNHVVQYGYDSEEGLQWLYEASASWVEVATAGADQDATGYVEIDFLAPELCWTTNTSGHNYAQWTLLQSLADEHGAAIVARLWENSVSHDGFETMSQTLAGVGTTIPAALQRWRAQNFARDYDLAPHFGRAVRLAGTIGGDGVWTPRGGVEQLGANYVTLRVDGARTYTLRGDENLELVALGLRRGRIEAFPLGRGGVFDESRFDYAALMVFNRAVPAQPGACESVTYTIDVTPAVRARAAAPAYQFSARHFAPLW
ncbi:MAG: pre-peptidase C-terminal domain-containing protein [Caulobacterales bacterium]|nr:pre-peptidase C-terminal domain-containing protein [Caulobacterales bacterium]